MTLFASFDTTADAEKAAAAILDRGARQEDLSIVAHSLTDEHHVEDVAKHGLTTTTGADAAMGAAKGLTFGMGLGMAGAVASLLIPGVGLVLGAGALATLIAGGAAAGAATGGIVGYLKDQGMGDEVAVAYQNRIATGGAVLALQIPTGDIDETTAESLLVKYGAVGVFTSYPTTTTDVAPIPDAIPRVVPTLEFEAANLQPLGSEVPVGAVTPTRSDPDSGLATEGYVEDPVTGVRRAVRFEAGRAYYVA